MSLIAIHCVTLPATCLYLTAIHCVTLPVTCLHLIAIHCVTLPVTCLSLIAIHCLSLPRAAIVLCRSVTSRTSLFTHQLWPRPQSGTGTGFLKPEIPAGRFRSFPSRATSFQGCGQAQLINQSISSYVATCQVQIYTQMERGTVLRAFIIIHTFTILGYQCIHFNNIRDKTQNSYKLTHSHRNHFMF